MWPVRISRELFTLASDASVSGHAFRSSLTRYLPPMLYDAERSALYLFPVLNVQSDMLSLSLMTAPDPSKAYFDVPGAYTVENLMGPSQKSGGLLLSECSIVISFSKMN